MLRKENRPNRPKDPNDPHYLEKTEQDLAKLIISKENFENSISLETSFNNEPIKIGSKLSSKYTFTSYTKLSQQLFLKYIYGKSFTAMRSIQKARIERPVDADPTVICIWKTILEMLEKKKKDLTTFNAISSIVDDTRKDLKEIDMNFVPCYISIDAACDLFRRFLILVAPTVQTDISLPEAIGKKGHQALIALSQAQKKMQTHAQRFIKNGSKILIHGNSKCAMMCISHLTMPSTIYVTSGISAMNEVQGTASGFVIRNNIRKVKQLDMNFRDSSGVSFSNIEKNLNDQFTREMTRSGAESGARELGGSPAGGPISSSSHLNTRENSVNNTQSTSTCTNTHLTNNFDAENFHPTSDMINNLENILPENSRDTAAHTSNQKLENDSAHESDSDSNSSISDENQNSDLEEDSFPHRHNFPDIKVIPDTAMAFYMNKVDYCLVGAEGVIENGGIINQIGTYQLSLLAKEFNKPFYVATESFKFMRKYPLSQDDLRNPKNSSPLVDMTPPDKISLFLTDLGVLTPGAVCDSLIKLYTSNA